MGTYTRGIVFLGLVILVVVGMAVWLAEVPESELLWASRIAVPVTGGLLLCFAAWANFLRKDRIPDYLRQQFRRPFEQDGFCFGVGCITRSTLCDWVGGAAKVLEPQYELMKT